MQGETVDSQPKRFVKSKAGSRQSLYAQSSDESQEEYVPVYTVKYARLPQKQQKSKTIQQNIATETQPLVQIINKAALQQLSGQPLGDFTFKPKQGKTRGQPTKRQITRQSSSLFTSQVDNNEPKGLQNSSVRREQRQLVSKQGWRTTKNDEKPAILKQPDQIAKNLPTLLQPLPSSSQYGSQFNNFNMLYSQWIYQFSQFPFKISLTLTNQKIQENLSNYLSKLVDLQNPTKQLPEPQWEQQRLKKYFMQYRPYNRKVTYRAITEKSKNLALKKYRNAVYFGRLQNGKKQGLGILIYFSGKRFQGVFQDDLKIQGFQLDDDMFFGEFSNGSRGFGICRNSKGISYGKTDQGLFIQKGVVFLLKNDNGIIKPAINHIYIGGSKHRQRMGVGMEKFPNGDLYVGNYDNDRPEGHGQYYWQNGAIYNGDFLSGLRHGYGKWMMPHGDSYEGGYMNDKKCGDGEYCWKNGTRYKGMFENDYRHGYGEMFWADGRTYKGNWTNGIENQKKLQYGKTKQQTAHTQASKRSMKSLLPILKQRRSLHYRTLNNRTMDAKPLHQARTPISRSITTGTRTSNGNSRTPNTRQNTRYNIMNSTHYSISKEGVKALFNPNFNFQY